MVCPTVRPGMDVVLMGAALAALDGCWVAAKTGVVVYAVKAVAKPAKLAGLALVLFYLFLGLEFVILLVLIFIIFQGLLIYTKNRDDSSLLVLLGFALIFVAHLVVLSSILDISGTQYLVAAAVQFVGFLSRSRSP